MLDLVKSLFSGAASEADPESARARGLEGAAATLMVEAACLDGEFKQSERDRIRSVLGEHFGLAPADADTLIAKAELAADDSTQIYGVVRVIRESLEPAERIDIIDMLWDVAYADGVVDDYEANLIRRVAGLLYVADRDSGSARKRAAERRVIGS